MEDSDTDFQEVNDDMHIVQDTVNVISTEQSQSESTNEQSTNEMVFCFIFYGYMHSCSHVQNIVPHMMNQ